MEIGRGTCLVCLTLEPRARLQRLAEQGYRTCGECGTLIRDALDDIVRLYADVDAAAGSAGDPDDLWPAASSNTGSRKPAYRSMPPVNLDKIDMTRRPAPRESEVLDSVNWWAWAVREATGIAHPSGPVTVAGEVNVLVRMWRWLRARDEVAEFGREMLQLRDRLRDATGVRWVQIGECPATIDRQTGARCRHKLYARLGERMVRCGRCSTPYPAASWLALARRMETG